MVSRIRLPHRRPAAGSPLFVNFMILLRRARIRTDELTMSIYSSIMVAGTPVCNAIFSAILKSSGYNMFADVALGTAGQSAAVQAAITACYIWVETGAYVLGAILIFFWTVEKDLPGEQEEIASRRKN